MLLKGLSIAEGGRVREMTGPTAIAVSNLVVSNHPVMYKVLTVCNVVEMSAVCVHRHPSTSNVQQYLLPIRVVERGGGKTNVRLQCGGNIQKIAVSNHPVNCRSTYFLKCC